MVTVNIDKEVSKEVDNILQISSLKIYYPNKRAYINQAIKEKNEKVKLEYSEVKDE